MVIKYGKPTHKEKALIKGKINSVFARSELHRQVLDAAVVAHSDPERPRVKTWVTCNVCKKPDARSYMDVDHIEPKVPVHKTFADMTLEEYVDRTWSDISNLQAICESCHNEKSKAERKLRRRK